MEKIFGYYDSPGQAQPSFDPGVGCPCPFCLKRVTHDIPMMTISLAPIKLDRSYFYRAHKSCYMSASDAEICDFESSVIDTK